MSQAGDGFMPTGRLLIEVGLDNKGEHSWHIELDGLPQTEAIGIMEIVSLRYKLQSIGLTRTIEQDGDDE